MSRPAPPTRRQLHFRSLDDIAAEVQRLASVPVVTTGSWTFPQILEHLAAGMRASIEGFSFNAPWWARTLVAPLVKNSFLTKPMKPGFKLPAVARQLLPRPDVRLDEGLASFWQGLQRLRTETARAPHPFVGQLTREEWNLLTQRHCELHLSFVLPQTG